MSLYIFHPDHYSEIRSRLSITVLKKNKTDFRFKKVTLDKFSETLKITQIWALEWMVLKK